MRSRHAFSLVELLVVVGVVAVLVGLLFPALSAARESATRVKCLATLRSMAQAAHAHAAEHRGYMPAAGHQGPATMGVFATSYGLKDAARRKYIYYKDVPNDDTWRPVPLPVALGTYMGLNTCDPGWTDPFWLRRGLMTDELYRPFACPAKSREEVEPGATLDDDIGVVALNVRMGYIFNAGMLARTVAPWGETPAGLMSRVRRPSDVFLFADGKSYGGWMGYGIHGECADGTLHMHGWFHAHMDLTRHRGRFNVVFVDGHAETLRLPDAKRSIPSPDNPGDLPRVGVTKGIFD